MYLLLASHLLGRYIMTRHIPCTGGTFFGSTTVGSGFYPINDGRVFTRQIQKSDLGNAREAEEAKQFELATLCLQK